jgi:hypothetical protein
MVLVYFPSQSSIVLECYGSKPVSVLINFTQLVDRGFQAFRYYVSIYDKISICIDIPEVTRHRIFESIAGSVIEEGTMKRVLGVLLAAILVAALAGCGGSSTKWEPISFGVLSFDIGTDWELSEVSSDYEKGSMNFRDYTIKRGKDPSWRLYIQTHEKSSGYPSFEDYVQYMYEVEADPSFDLNSFEIDSPENFTLNGMPAYEYSSTFEISETGDVINMNSVYVENDDVYYKFMFRIPREDASDFDAVYEHFKESIESA